jgi:peptidoglycan hydrolase-like protein with peptidoglycan-binding domain
MTGPNRRRRRRTGRVVVVVVAALAVAAAATAATGFGLGGFGTSRGDGKGSGSLPPATAQVIRQDLVERRTEDGRLGYGDATIVSDRLGGTLTWLPAVGATVKRGQPLFRVDNTPVVLLYGTLPAYRTLAVGTEGPDVTQFERNLKALGYSGFTVDDEYTASTAAAVRRWQEKLDLPKTGMVELGRVTYAADQVRVASHEASVGDALQPTAAVLAHTGTTRVVTVDLDVSDRPMARKGAAVTCTLPDGKTVPGEVAQTETVISGSGENAQQESETILRVTVRITDPKALAGLDEATVPVAFTAAKREKVLTVPVAALLALAEGGYGVQVVADGTTRIVPVQTGLFADGRVEISGDGVVEGMTVGMPS